MDILQFPPDYLPDKEKIARLPIELQTHILYCLSQPYTEISSSSRCYNIRDRMQYVTNVKYIYPFRARARRPWPKDESSPIQWLYLGRMPIHLREIAHALNQGHDVYVKFPDYVLAATHVSTLRVVPEMYNASTFVSSRIFSFQSKITLEAFLLTSPQINGFKNQISSVCLRLYTSSQHEESQNPGDTGFNLLIWFVDKVTADSSFLPNLQTVEVELFGLDLRGPVPQAHDEDARFNRLRFLVTLSLKLMSATGRPHKINVTRSGFTCNKDWESYYDQSFAERAAENQLRDNETETQRDQRLQASENDRRVKRCRGLHWGLDDGTMPEDVRKYAINQHNQIRLFQRIGSSGNHHHSVVNSDPMIQAQALELRNYIWMAIFDQEIQTAEGQIATYKKITTSADLVLPRWY